MLIISALKHDNRLRQGINYVEAVLQAYQRYSRLNPTIQSPLELQFDEIGVVLDEHSDAYTIGEQASNISSTFNTDALNGILHKAIDTPIIYALRNQSKSRPYDKRNAWPDNQDYGARIKRDATKACRACLSVSHCITSGDIYYTLAKATLCKAFLSNNEKKDMIKRNIRDYRKERKYKQFKNRTTSRMRGAIHKMYTKGTS